jgi:DegV family protein with EDD domain
MVSESKVAALPTTGIGGHVDGEESTTLPGVHVVTDSSSDLIGEQLDEFAVEIVPLSIRFGDEEFTDGVELSVADFYRRMDSCDELPQTACPSPGAFEQAFARAHGAGADAVVCLTISGDLSNTLQSAQTASDAVSGLIPVQVIDSRSVSSGLGTLVMQAATTATATADLDAVVSRVRSLIPRTHVIAALNTLENLKKGGRIGGAAAMVGSILSIKPVIDISGGVVHEAGKPRTRKKAMDMLYEQMVEAGSIEQVAVMHGGAPDIGDFLDLISPRFPRESIRLGQLGAVIGSHGGAEIIGVSWIAPTGDP